MAHLTKTQLRDIQAAVDAVFHLDAAAPKTRAAYSIEIVRHNVDGADDTDRRTLGDWYTSKQAIALLEENGAPDPKGMVTEAFRFEESTHDVGDTEYIVTYYRVTV